MPHHPLHPPTDDAVTLIRGGAVRGFGEGTEARPGEPGGAEGPGAVAVRGGRVVAAGACGDIERRFAGAVRRRIERPSHLLLPGLVNAHSHLELADIGPRPYPGTFTEWVRQLVAARPRDARAVGRAVSRGIERSLAAGVEVVGDIGGAPFGQQAAWRALQDSPMRGVYFPEFIAHDGPRAEAELARLDACAGDAGPHTRLRRGVSPHAPYSTSRLIYEACTRHAETHACVASTHLAETPDEAEFVAGATGPFRALLESINQWADHYARDYIGGISPVRWMEPYLRRVPWLLAHCNYVSDEDIALLAETGTSVAYCPLASEYFGHRNHRYREMMEAGVNVCLGTDSIVCQPAPPEVPQPLGLLSAMRRLHQCDRMDPAVLLRMATTHGRRALKLDDTVTLLATIRFDPDDQTDALRQVLLSTRPVEAIMLADLPPR